MLDNFLDFILWGHEHECLIHPQQSAVGDFHICQPGAPLVTSLCEAEAKQKFVGVLEVYQNKFRLKEIPLRAMRPFVMDSVEFPESGPFDFDPESVEEVSKYVSDRVEGLIAKAKDLPYGNDMLPLVRLRIDHFGGVALPNLHRFSAMYVGRIANPNEVLLIKRKRSAVVRVPRIHSEEGDALVRQSEEDGENEPKIGDVINSYIERELLNELFVQDEEELNSALFDFVEKMDSHSFDKCVQKSTLTASETVDQTEVFNPADPDKMQSIREILTVQRKKRKEERPKSSKDVSLRILKAERADNDSSPHIIEEEGGNSPSEEIMEEELPSTPPQSRKRKHSESESASNRTKGGRKESEAPSQPNKRARQVRAETPSVTEVAATPIQQSASVSSSSSNRNRPSLQIEAVTPSKQPQNEKANSQSQSTRANPLLSVLTNTTSTSSRDQNEGNSSKLTSNVAPKRVLPSSLARKTPKMEESEEISILSSHPPPSFPSPPKEKPSLLVPPNANSSESQTQSQRSDSQFQRSQQWGRRKTKN